MGVKEVRRTDLIGGVTIVGNGYINDPKVGGQGGEKEGRSVTANGGPGVWEAPRQRMVGGGTAPSAVWGRTQHQKGCQGGNVRGKGKRGRNGGPDDK